MREFSGIPLLLIIIGIGYLLANLGIISFTPWQTFIHYWPVLIVLLGIKIGVNSFRDEKSNNRGLLLFPLFLTAWGMFLLLPRLGFPGFKFTWGLIWPTGLIIIGLSTIINSRKTTRKNNLGDHTIIIGELRRGGEAWYVDDTNISHGIGEVKFDFTNAVIPDKEIFFNISGLVGEVTIYLPPDLPLKAQCHIGVGEVSLLNECASGISRKVEFESVEYKSSTRKLNLVASLKIGDITIRRIG